MLKNEKGITLASLVVTVIVLLIIASVGTASGISAVSYVKFNNAKAQFQTMQSYVNLWYEQKLEYGEVIESKADTTKLDKMESDLSISDFTSAGYKYFSATYIKDTLDIEGISHDFLINISTRTVLLFGGIEYQGEIYYSAENFGINIVEFEEIGAEDKITFAEPVIQDNKIIIYNIEFPNNMNISKYNVQYQLPTEDGTTNWNTLTSDKKGTYTYTDEEGNEKEDNDAWTIECSVSGEYNIRITTASEDIFSGEETISITVE